MHQQGYAAMFLLSAVHNFPKFLEIVRYLNDKGYRSRLNRDWGYGVVKGILKRLES